jgi:predicted RNase H-like HicB family nuclease
VEEEGFLRSDLEVSHDSDWQEAASCSIPGCVSQGQTEAEAEANNTDAIRECLAVRAELGLPSKVTLREVEVAV